MARLSAPLLVCVVVAACASVPAIPARSLPAGASTTGANPNPDPGSSGGAASAIDSCTVLGDRDIKAATGEGVTQRRSSTLTQVFPSVCDIDLDGGGSLTVSVKTSGGRQLYETSFEPFIGQGDTGYLDEVVAGLGDKAARSGDDTIMVLTGDTLFDILYIEFGRADKFPIVRYLAERVLARLPCLASGCPDLPLPPVPTGGSEPTATPLSVDPGSLPSTGAQARVVNLYNESGQPVAIDVYAYTWSDTDQMEVGALVATVPYGSASTWFNPGLVKSPFGEDPYTRIDIFRSGDHTSPMTSLGEFLGPGTVTTIAVWQEEFGDEPHAWAQAMYAEHPTYPVPSAPNGQALLTGSTGGLRGEDEPPTLYTSVGDGCLESTLGRSDPDFPNAQPLGNEVALPTGPHTLNVFDEPAGELPTCDGKPAGPGAPIDAAPGDRWLAFPYRLPGGTDVNLLVMPFEP